MCGITSAVDSTDGVLTRTATGSSGSSGGFGAMAYPIPDPTSAATGGHQRPATDSSSVRRLYRLVHPVRVDQAKRLGQRLDLGQHVSAAGAVVEMRAHFGAFVRVELPKRVRAEGFP